MKRVASLERMVTSAVLSTGLDEESVRASRARHGANQIVEAPRHRWWDVLGDALRDPMTWFLAAASVLFAVSGERTEAIVLAVALVPFLGMDFFLHRRTSASIQGLSRSLASRATVIRAGHPIVIASVEVVPGDIVIATAGESFPADGLLAECDGVLVDESLLTGEAHPVRKEPLEAWPQAAMPIAIDGRQWGFAGTRVLSGSARMVVVFTGAQTLYGDIVRSAVHGAHDRTPLQRAVADLVRILVVAAAGLCVVLGITRLLQGYGPLDAILSALTLAVAALPEEFPVVLTFFLGVGVYRLARRQALVRRGVVVESIGRVTTLCTDKTGTITQGRLELTHCHPVSGLDTPDLLARALSASRPELGDPVDVAIARAAPSGQRGSVVARFPFTEARKRETVLVATDVGLRASMKGAPETVLGECGIDSTEAARWLDRVEVLARDGHRVLACASRMLPVPPAEDEEPTGDFGLDGLLAFEDPIRPSAAPALGECAAAGIRVLMVSGDHPLTCRAVAREVGLGRGGVAVVDGAEMMERLDREGAAFLGQIDVVARALPAHKLALVRALRADGEIVAVTGDGVNDVPALQSADIGIAMGERGTRSAREVAAIVLLDDDIRTVVGAIAEGRQLFENLRASFLYLLMIHIPLVATATVLPLAGYPLLYLPVHVVWLEMIIHPTALLAFQQRAPAGPLTPHARRRTLLATREWVAVGLTALALTLVVGGSYLRSLGTGLDVEHGRAMALVALTVGSAGVTLALSRLRGRAATAVILAALLSAVVLVQTPALAALIHLRPLHFDDWLIAAAGGLAAGLAATLASLASRHEHRRSGHAARPREEVPPQ